MEYAAVGLCFQVPTLLLLNTKVLEAACAGSGTGDAVVVLGNPSLCFTASSRILSSEEQLWNRAVLSIAAS